MNDPAPCCRELTRLRRAKSPFTRIIALDWYDGPRGSLLQCGRCDRESRFERLDESIHDDEGQDVRIFGLAPLPAHSLDRFVEALSRYQSPNQPVWVPLWTFPTEAEQAALDSLA